MVKKIDNCHESFVLGLGYITHDLRHYYKPIRYTYD